MNKMKIGDFVMIVVVLVAALGIFFYYQFGTPNGYGEEVVVEVDGQVVKTISLPQEDYEWKYVAEDGDYNLIQVKGHTVRIVDATCPDQVCTNEGWKSKPGSTIVCLPHKLVVKIVGGEANDDGLDLDGVTF